MIDVTSSGSTSPCPIAGSDGLPKSGDGYVILTNGGTAYTGSTYAERRNPRPGKPQLDGTAEDQRTEYLRSP